MTFKWDLLFFLSHVLSYSIYFNFFYFFFRFIFTLILDIITFLASLIMSSGYIWIFWWKCVHRDDKWVIESWLNSDYRLIIVYSIFFNMLNNLLLHIRVFFKLCVYEWMCPLLQKSSFLLHSIIHSLFAFRTHSFNHF